MDEKPSQQPIKGYGKHSKTYWIVLYLIVAAIVYGLIFILLIHKGGSGGYGY